MKANELNAENVLGKIEEILNYYESCEALSGSSVRISKSMLAFALGVDSMDGVEPVLQELYRQGRLAVMRNDDLVFAPAVPNGGRN